METLREVAEGIEWRDVAREPRIMMLGFGDSSVDFEVSVWVQDPWESLHRRSDLNQAMWWALQDRGITIAFPQLDVHFDRPFEAPAEGLQGVG